LFEITEVIRNIPFKIFNVKEYKENYYIVEPRFPLIKEIMEDVYKYLIIKKNFNVIKNLVNKKGSAFSTLFELKVRYDFYPPIRGDVDYFKDFVIQDSVNMEVIIPKKKEKQTIKFIKKLDLDKAYLVEQKQFGGKYLDFLIIHMTKDPKVFGFQVSTYKPKIFKNLDTTYEVLIKRLYWAFDLNIKEGNVYFGYIFDYSRKKEKKYTSMINNCNNYNMKYSYYDFEKNVLYDDKGKETHNIYDITGVPKISKKKDNKIDKYFQNIFLKENNPLNKLNGGQISTIIDILKLEKKDESISSLKFVQQYKNIRIDKNYVSIVPNYENNNLLIFFVVNEFLVSKIINSNKEVQDNTIYYSDKFDIYKIKKK